MVAWPGQDVVALVVGRDGGSLRNIWDVEPSGLTDYTQEQGDGGPCCYLWE